MFTLPQRFPGRPFACGQHLLGQSGRLYVASCVWKKQGKKNTFLPFPRTRACPSHPQAPACSTHRQPGGLIGFFIRRGQEQRKLHFDTDSLPGVWVPRPRPHRGGAPPGRPFSSPCRALTFYCWHHRSLCASVQFNHLSTLRPDRQLRR